jgi:CMP-N-acetylneuraminic acid synthetase
MVQYIFKPNILTKHNNRLGGTIGYSLMDPWKIYEIDSYDDLEMCEFLFEQRVK